MRGCARAQGQPLRTGPTARRSGTATAGARPGSAAAGLGQDRRLRSTSSASGERSFPYHFHHGMEEWLIVVAGTPALRGPDGERALRARRRRLLPGRARGRAPGARPGTVLMLSASRAPETIEYPDSGKVGVTPAGQDLPRWPTPSTTGRASERAASTSTTSPPRATTRDPPGYRAPDGAVRRRRSAPSSSAARSTSSTRATASARTTTSTRRRSGCSCSTGRADAARPGTAGARARTRATSSASSRARTGAHKVDVTARSDGRRARGS